MGQRTADGAGQSGSLDVKYLWVQGEKKLKVAWRAGKATRGAGKLVGAKASAQKRVFGGPMSVLLTPLSLSRSGSHAESAESVTGTHGASGVHDRRRYGSVSVSAVHLSIILP